MYKKITRKIYEAVETKAVEGEDRTLIVTVSTGNPDRDKDVVVPAGREAENYLKSPVVAALQRYDQPAIARTLELQQTENRIIAKLESSQRESHP